MPVRRLEMALQPQPIDDVTFEELQHRRQLAKEARGKQSFKNIQHPTQGLANLMDAFNAREYNRQELEAEEAFKSKTEANETGMVDALAGLYSPGASNLGNNVPSAAVQGESGMTGPGNTQTGAQGGGIRLPDGRTLSGDQMRALLANKATRGFATKLLASQIGKANAQPKDERTTFQKNYEYARSQGFQGSPMDFKKAGAVNVSVGAGEKEQDKVIGKGFGKMVTDAFAHQQTITREIQDLSTLGDALQHPSVHTGTFGNLSQAGKKAFGSVFGINVDGVPEGEVAQRIMTSLGLAEKKNLPGPLSNSDRDFLMAIPPGLSKTKEGNRRLVAFGLEYRKWEAARNDAIIRYAQNNNNRLDLGVYGTLGALDQEFGGRMKQLTAELRDLAGQSQQTRPTAGTQQLWDQYGLE